VLTIPRLLRPLFRRRRDLLTELARAGAEATVELVRRTAGLDLRPGLVVSVATAGDLLQWHPHLHLLTSDGGFAADGTFVDHLGLCTPQDKPPPIREIRRVAEQGESWGVPASWD
jgi:hypothetical protein